MSELIRFQNWIIDREQLQPAKIRAIDNKNYDDFEKIQHDLILKLKSGEEFKLICEDRYDAKRQLDFLTTQLEAHYLGGDFGHYMIRQLYICRQSIDDLKEDIRKLINSYKKIKNKEIKNDNTKT